MPSKAIEYPTAQYNLGVVFLRSGNLAGALSAFRIATEKAPEQAKHWVALGRTHLRRDDFANAAKAFRAALDRNPSDAPTWAHLSTAQRFLKDYDQAINAAKQALRLVPESEATLIALLHAKMRACDWDSLEEIRDRLKAAVTLALDSGKPIRTRPFQAVVTFDDPQFQKKVADAEAAALNRKAAAPKPIRDDVTTVGYLSAGFGMHPTGHLTRGLFAAHDRSKVKVVALSMGPDDGSALRGEIARGVDRFVNLDGHSDDRAAAIIQAEKVDVLVDLHGYLQGHRAGIIARRPAPVCVNYLGFPGTCGTGLHDYILLDKVIAPDDALANFGEAVVRLPGSYQVNDPRDFVGKVKPQRSDHGLPDGPVFCSFNMPYKIEPQAFDAWCEILQKCPDAVLWLLQDGETGPRNMARAARAKGIDPDRLIFAPPMDRHDHLARLTLAEVALDTWTCGGHTTTTDCLLAGVPVITRVGGSFAARVAASLLTHADLPDCVTQDRDAYIQAAVDMMENAQRRAAVQEQMLGPEPKPSLFDIDGKARALELAFVTMVDRGANGHDPASFDVS